MKTILLKNEAGTINASYLTDLIGKNEEFTVFTQDGTSNGLSDTEIQNGLDLAIKEYNVRAIEQLAITKQLIMELYSEQESLAFKFGISTLPDGSNGVAYSQAITNSGGTAPLTYTQETGTSLVTGLSFNTTTGTVEGTPSTTGDCTLVCKIKDANGYAIIGSFTFTVS